MSCTFQDIHLTSTCNVLQLEVKQVTSSTQVNGGRLIISTSSTTGFNFLAIAKTSGQMIVAIGRMYQSQKYQIECNNKKLYRVLDDDDHCYSPLFIIVDCRTGSECASTLCIPDKLIENDRDEVVGKFRLVPLRDAIEVEHIPDDSSRWRRSINDTNLQVKLALQKSKIGELVSNFTDSPTTDSFLEKITALSLEAEAPEENISGVIHKATSTATSEDPEISSRQRVTTRASTRTVTEPANKNTTKINEPTSKLAELQSNLDASELVKSD